MVSENVIAISSFSTGQSQEPEISWAKPDRAESPKKCFVIMPFGKKENTDGEVIDFAEVYQSLIKPTVEALGITCVRCDEIAETGWIHSKMFGHIYESELAVVDITSFNPNVFYELGVRHALVKTVTVILRKKGTLLPYNIQAFQVIEYDLATPLSIIEGTGLLKSGV